MTGQRREDRSDLVGRLLRPARAVYVAVLFLLAVALTGVCLYLYVHVRSDEARLRTDLAAQTHNRALNVLLWCGHINQLDRTLIAYVDGFANADPRIPRLHLTPLPCLRLALRTLASTKPH